MSRQLKISDEVYEMLLLLKPFPDYTFNDIILLLIEAQCSNIDLRRELDAIKKLENENPQEAAAERLLLQKDVFNHVVIDMLISQKESDDEAALYKYQMENIPEMKETQDHLEQYRRKEREKLLFRIKDSKKEGKDGKNDS